MSDAPDYPLTQQQSTQVNFWLNAILVAIKEGDTNPHWVLRRILGRVYADGYRDGRVSMLMDRPLDDALLAVNGDSHTHAHTDRKDDE
jgi:hypothetical protein